MPRSFINIPIPLNQADDFYQEWLRAKKQTAESPKIIVDKRYDPNMPFGEAMKKMIAPPNSAGMKPTWTQKTRERYRACIKPDLDIYMSALEKLNRSAQEKYDDQTKEYVRSSLGFGGLSSLSAAFLADKEIKVRYSFKGRNIVTGGGMASKSVRVFFWCSFIWGTNSYIDSRLITMERDYREFEELTETFFKKVNLCRKENPYDSWILKSLEEQYYDQIVFYPNYVHHPHRWLTVPID